MGKMIASSQQTIYVSGHFSIYCSQILLQNVKMLEYRCIAVISLIETAPTCVKKAGSTRQQHKYPNLYQLQNSAILEIGDLSIYIKLTCSVLPSAGLKASCS